MSKWDMRNAAAFTAIGVGAGILVPFCAMGISLAVDSMFEDWVFFSKLSIGVLGVVCIIPLLYGLVKQGTRKFEFFSPTAIFPLLYFAVFGLGSLGLLARDNPHVIVILWYAIGGMIFYYIGVVFTGLALNFSKERKTTRRVVSVDWDPYLVKVLISFLLVIGLFATVYHAWKTGLPIFIPNLEEVRIKVQQEVSNYVIFLMRLITPAYFFLLTYGLLYRKVKRVTLVFLFLAGISVLVSLANRHDIFTFLIGSVIIYNFAGKKVSLSKLLATLFTGLVFLMSVSFYRLAILSHTTPEKAFLMKVAGTNTARMFVAYMILQFTVYPTNFATYLETFPRVLPFEWGYSFVRAVSTILPGHQELLDEYVKSSLKLDFLGGGINPTLLGELYANFGYAGIVVMGVYGVVITFLFRKMLESRDGIFVVSYAYGISCLLLATIGGFFSYFLFFYYIVVMAFMHLMLKRKRFSEDFIGENSSYK